MLKPADHALHLERGAEHLVDPRKHPQATGAVQVQKIDVGHLAGGDQLGEHQHEALLHRRAGEGDQAG